MLNIAFILLLFAQISFSKIIKMSIETGFLNTVAFLSEVILVVFKKVWSQFSHRKCIWTRLLCGDFVDMQNKSKDYRNLCKDLEVFSLCIVSIKAADKATWSKRPPGDVLENCCFQKFHKIDRKELLPKSLFDEQKLSKSNYS